MSNRLRIGLIAQGGKDWIGGAIYTKTLARAIGMAAERERSDVLVDIPERRIDYKLFETGKSVAARLPFVPLALCNPRGYDFVYPTLAGKRAPFRWGAWIPDFQEIYLPQFFSEEIVAKRKERYRRAADCATVIVLSSEMARQDFARLFSEAAERSRILRFPSYPEPEWTAGNPCEVQEKFELPNRFFIVCNQFWMHKDHATVFRALKILKDRGITPVVACTGYTDDPRNPAYFSTLTSMLDEFGIRDQVRILGLIPRVEQIQLIRRSLAVIQPSLFEGWSTVVEDARTLAKPILLSDFPVHREQNPPGVEFFDQGNAEGLAELMADAAQRLSPGPDLEREEAATAQAREKTISFGDDFLRIAREALGR